MRKKSSLALYDRLVLILLYWVSLQDFVLPLVYSLTGNLTLAKLLFYFKDVLLIVLFVVGIFKGRCRDRSEAFLIIYFGYLVLMAGVGYLKGIDLATLAGSLRSWILAPCLMVIGFNLSRSQGSFNKILKFFSRFFVFVAILGIIEYVTDVYITSTIPFWTDVVKIGDFITDVKGMGKTLVYGLPGNFYGSYGNGYFSTKTLVSIYGNHLTFAYLAAIPCFYYFYSVLYRKKRRPFVQFAIVYVSLLLSYTRIIIFMVTLIMVAMAIVKSGRFRTFAIAALPVFAVVLMMNINRLISYVVDGSTIGHIASILGALESISPLGNGIATFGIWGGVGTESTYLSCLGQLGLLGLLMYLICNFVPVASVASSFKFSQKKGPYDFMALAVISASIVMLASGLISEQLGAYTSIAPFYVLLGYYAREAKRQTARSIQPIYVKGKICELCKTL